jgi:hypothetical protein
VCDYCLDFYLSLYYDASALNSRQSCGKRNGDCSPCLGMSPTGTERHRCARTFRPKGHFL